MTPPNVTKNTMYFLKKLDQYWGTFPKKYFASQKGQNTCKNFLFAKIGEKWQSIGVPPHFLDIGY